MIIPKKLGLVGRVILAIGALVGSVNASNIRIWNFGEGAKNVGGSSVNLKNISDANEAFDVWDVNWVGQQPNPLEKWLKIHSEPYVEELQIDSRPINSTTTIHEKLSVADGLGFPGSASVPCSNKIKFQIVDNTDLEWKNIIAERYGLDDVNNPSNIKDIWDVKYKDGQYIYLDDITDLTSRVYDNILIKPFNHADLNRDGKVNNLDYNILANNWRRTGIDKGSNPTDVNDYADIDGTTVVDNNDLREFSYEWLWDADDPNTW